MSVWNQGNWHWEEKDYSKWACEKLDKDVLNLEMEVENGKISISSSKTKGDACINIRKGKRICSYDLKMEIDWKGKVGDIDISGKINISDVDDSTDTDDYVIKPTINLNGQQYDKIVEKIKKEFFKEQILPKINEMISELKEK
eukprot:Anaeramoba_ignava/a487281_16.p1 GENE.a487281_16~~a487281_16.p1  ORF type:complete len:143 (+),score=51.69 a487281_16:27-455(+)